MSLVPVRFVNPLFAAVKNVCSETLHVPFTAGPLRLLRPSEQLCEPLRSRR